MPVQAIDYLQLDFLPKLIRDYLKGEERLKPFYQYPFDFNAFKQVIADRKFSPENRKVLVEALERQNSKLNVCEKVSGNIQKLRDPNTFTVVTAHQPVIFTGPLYFIYKIISAISLAERLQKTFPDKHFVPVYYMGAEDHDFDEINHLWLGNEKLEWQHDRRGAVGRISTNDITVLTQEIGTRLHGEFAEGTAQLLNAAYRANSTLADATAHFVNSIFGEQGLVVLNPDDAELKKLFIPVIEDEVLNRRAMKACESTLDSLQSLGYDVQATPREINLFYLGNSFRERIVFDEETKKYRVLNTQLSFTPEEIVKELQAFPEHFSPNVMLRPLYQETILPNLAYVGGAGELSYWLQQKEIFKHYGVNYPMLVQRNSAVLIDAATQKKIEKTGVELKELFQDEDTLVKEFVKRTSNNNLDLSAEKERINELFNAIREKAVVIDPTLAGAVEAQKAATINNVDGLEKKILKAEKRNFETTTTQLKAIRTKLFPDNNMQERVENFLPYYAAGGEQFLNALKAEFDPFRKEMVFLPV